MTPDASPRDDVALSVREHLVLGLKWQQAGSMDAAHAAYETALAQAPLDPLVLGLLGSLETTRGNPGRGESLLKQAAVGDPSNASTVFNLGLAILMRNRPAEALGCFERALVLRPRWPTFLLQRAETVAITGDRHEASAAWETLLAACDENLPGNQNDPRAQFCKGCALLGLERAEEALEIFAALSVLRPGDPEVLTRKAIALMAVLDFAEARTVLEASLRLDPSSRLTRLNLGNALFHLQELEAAVALFRELSSKSPHDATIYLNLGVALREMGLLDQALACFDRAVTLRPSWRDALMTRAYCFLAMGNFQRGWAEHEHRVVDAAVPWMDRDFGCPAWDGYPDLNGRTVLVWAEQGFGDTIQFSRYASELGKLGARVVLEVHRPLLRLLQGLAHVHQVVPFGSTAARCDFHCALMSLPHLLGPRVDGIPSRSPYLTAQPPDIAKWAPRMLPALNVGLAWTGNPEHSNDHRRSMPLSRLAACLPQGVNWWCVQKDVRDSDAHVLRDVGGIQRPPLGDFGDTAGLMANLDAIVAVDTSVAHLAGALGRPTFVLLPHSAEWRWQTGRADSPWYEHMRLYRQRARGDWESALQDVAARIRSMAMHRPIHLVE